MNPFSRSLLFDPGDGPPLSRRDAGYALAAMAVTILAFLRAVPHEFIVNWDDAIYVTQNEAIRDWSWRGVWKLFSTFHLENYHPLTNLSNMLEYRLFGSAPLPYHLINVLLHVANAGWVYLFVRAVSGRRAAAFPAALIFGIHPMHVESVAWISERKDVLYAFFYLAALTLCVRALRRGTGWMWVGLLFLCSCLSKSAAVTFPVVMLLLAGYLDVRPRRAAALRAIPFFCLSALFGALALLSQNATGATALVPHYPWPQRLLLAGDALSYYLLTFFFPWKLSILHSYPFQPGAAVPPALFIAPLLPAAAALAIARAPRVYRRDLACGGLFFLATLLPILQIVPVGRAIVAERYTYIPYVGLGFALCMALVRWIEADSPATRWSRARWLRRGLIVWATCLFAATVARTGAWKNGETLFTDAIGKEGDRALLHYNRGFAREMNGNHAGAIADFDEAIRLDPAYAAAYSNRGSARFSLGDRDGAIRDYTRAIELDPVTTDGYYNRGHVRESMGDTQGALADYTSAIGHRSESADISYTARGNLKQGLLDYPGAVADYDAALRLKPGNRSAWFNRGNARFRLHDLAGALDDYREASRLDPGWALPFYTMGLVRIELGLVPAACEDFATSRRLGYEGAQEMMIKLCP